MQQRDGRLFCLNQLQGELLKSKNDQNALKEHVYQRDSVIATLKIALEDAHQDGDAQEKCLADAAAAAKVDIAKRDAVITKRDAKLQQIEKQFAELKTDSKAKNATLSAAKAELEKKVKHQQAQKKEVDKHIQQLNRQLLEAQDSAVVGQRQSQEKIKELVSICAFVHLFAFVWLSRVVFLPFMVCMVWRMNVPLCLGLQEAKHGERGEQIQMLESTNEELARECSRLCGQNLEACGQEELSQVPINVILQQRAALLRRSCWLLQVRSMLERSLRLVAEEDLRRYRSPSRPVRNSSLVDAAHVAAAVIHRHRVCMVGLSSVWL